MTSPRLTWLPKWRRWSQGAVAELPRLRARYGDAVADAAELARDRIDDLKDQPAAADVRHTLRRLAADPSPRRRLPVDGQSETELQLHAWRLFREWDLDLLTDADLRTAAAHAAVTFEKECGNLPTDAHAVPLVASVLRAWESGLHDTELARLRERARRRGVHRHKAFGEVSEDERHQLSAARTRLLRFTLSACGIGSGVDNIGRLITEAGRVV